MTYEELKIQLDINDPVEVLKHVGRIYVRNRWFVICDEGDCHLFDDSGDECDIKEVTELSSIIVPKGIKKVVIPSSVTSIADYTFWNRSSLTSVVIPDGVTYIRGYTFIGCSSLESVMIPDSVTRIGYYAFQNCSSLTSVTIPDSVKSIGYGAFKDCNKLMTVIVGNDVTIIEDKAFIWCESLECLAFKGKTIEQVKAMDNYPWELKNKSVIRCI